MLKEHKNNIPQDNILDVGCFGLLGFSAPLTLVGLGDLSYLSLPPFSTIKVALTT